jgi:CheY-like chemotaxis protein
MLVIDTEADAKLIKALEAIRTQPYAAQCVYFKLANMPLPQDMAPTVVNAARFHITGDDIQIYLCEDGDIFVLTHAIHPKAARLLMLEIASYAGRPLSDQFAEHYDLKISAGKLLVLLQAKEDKRLLRKEAEEAERQRAVAQHKREWILQAAPVDSAAIASKRAARHEPHLMIIEDDAFTRRLVESTVQKHYPITALGTAEKALITYASTAPNLLFLDINLPDVTGHELLERIMALDPQAYVVMLSGNADRDNIMHAMQRGAKGFIAKPFTREKLFQYIDRCLNPVHA